MNMHVTAAGNGIPPAEKTHERIFSKSAQNIAAEHKAAAKESISITLPGNRKGPPPSIMVNLEKITVAFNKKLKFEVNHQSNDVIVKVLDPETDKVIKVLPPEELQRLHSRLKETIGFLFDERI